MQAAIRIVLLLLIGAVITIIVAWRCAIVGAEQAHSSVLPTEEAERMWREALDPVPPGHVITGQRLSVAGYTWIIMSDYPDDPRETRPFNLIVRRHVGWPLHACWGDQIVHMTPTGERSDYHGLLALPNQIGPWRPAGAVLPYRPDWVGLIVDTLVFGAAAMLAGSLIARLRRRARLDRKHCPRCRYDLHAMLDGNDITCSECGTALPAHLLARPRQIWRWWFLPILLPAFALAVVWFLGLVNWMWLRFELRWQEPMLSASAIISIAIGAAWLFAVAMLAYADRPRKPRIALAVLIALGGAIAIYVPTYALVVRLSGWGTI